MTVSPESDVRGLGDTKMKELILGDKAGTGAAETLHIQENGCLGMIEGDWRSSARPNGSRARITSLARSGL